MSRNAPLLSYHQVTDTFNLHGPHGEGLITLSVEELKILVQESNKLLQERSLRRREWESKTPINDSAEIPHQEA